MFRNYLARRAARNLVRNRVYAAINIVGLAVGFAAALLIALFVRHELTAMTAGYRDKNVFIRWFQITPGIVSGHRAESTA